MFVFKSSVKITEHKINHFKVLNQCHLVLSQYCATTISIKFQNIFITPKVMLCIHWALASHSAPPVPGITNLHCLYRFICSGHFIQMESPRVSCVWLLPLSIMFSGFIYVVACLHHNFILFSDCIIFHCMMDHIWLIHSLVSGWFLTILNCEHSSICSSLLGFHSLGAYFSEWNSWEDKYLFKTPTVPSNACSSERLRLSLPESSEASRSGSIPGKAPHFRPILTVLKKPNACSRKNGERQFATAYYLDL